MRGRQRKTLFSSLYVFIALTIVSFLLLLFSTSGFVVDIRNAGLSVFSGLRGGIYSVTATVTRTFFSLRELSSLRKEYVALLERVTRYERNERSAAELRQENERLRAQLEFARTLRLRYIPAEISGRDPDNLYAAFVINKGSAHGVRTNMPVIAYQDGTRALAGKILHAGALESIVLPLYDEKAYVSARLSQSRYEGIVQGRGNVETPLIMTLLPKRAREEAQEGEAIITSGTGGVYPPGITIGRISSIIYHDYESQLELELSPAVDFSRLEYVFVIDKEASDSSEP